MGNVGSEFRRQRILSDNGEDGKLMGRLNQVMRRLGLYRLPDGFADLLPDDRRLIDVHLRYLLDVIPTAPFAV